MMRPSCRVEWRSERMSRPDWIGGRGDECGTGGREAPEPEGHVGVAEFPRAAEGDRGSEPTGAGHGTPLGEGKTDDPERHRRTVQWGVGARSGYHAQRHGASFARDGHATSAARGDRRSAGRTYQG